MANITDLTEATYPFNGTEYKEVIQGGNSRKALDWNGVETLTGSATMTSGNRLILLNAASGTVTVPTTVPVGQDVEFMKIHASAGTWTGARSGSETFAGATSFTLTEQYERQVWTKVTTTRYERKLWTLGAQEYEVGTWTPEYQPSAGAFGSVTYSSQVGRYIIVARECRFWASLQSSSISVGTASGDVSFTLPVTASGGTTQSGAHVPYSAAFAGDNPSGALVPDGSAICTLYYRTSANGLSSIIQVSDLTTGSGNSIRVAGSYLI